MAENEQKNLIQKAIEKSTKSNANTKVASNKKEGVKMSKSKISNQNKKIKQKKEKFLPGEKIKDIEIDLKSYKQFSLIVLLISDIMLFAVLLVMLCLVHNWWICLIFVLLFGLCVWWSVDQLCKAKYQKVYALHDNCIVVKSIVVYAIIKLEDICDVEPCHSLRDKLHKTDAHALAFYLSPKHKNKIVIGFINEDLNALTEQIKELIKQAKQKKLEKLEQTKTTQN